jgi:hydroxymethylpyrimidine/phosphomethylpyrimidine kinase
MNYITTLTIAGSDCSGGAGIQADIKTFSALGCFAATAVTAVTVQGSHGVGRVLEIPADLVASQVSAVLNDLHPRASKVGMAVNRSVIAAIGHALRKTTIPVVVDPVLVATSGARLLAPDAIEALRSQLLPLATLLTPNIPEAEALTGMTIACEDDIDLAAHRLLYMGCKAVLIKGGHWAGEYKTDRLYMPGTAPLKYTGRTISTANTHGTGCTLSAAITAYLARGFALPDAVGSAHSYLCQALRAGASVHVHEGNGPLNHLFNPEKLIIE